MSETAVFFLVGPTASGKTAVAVDVAKRLGAEIISMDSMALYRGMDIATAKPSAQERAQVPHHLIDILGPHEHSSVGEYRERAHRAIEEIRSRGRAPLFTGGTPLYLKAMTEGIFDGPAADWSLRERLTELARREGTKHLHEMLAKRDSAAARRIHPNDLRRLVRALEVYEKEASPISSLQTQFGKPHGRFACIIAGLRRTREDLYARIDRRVETMFAEGLVEETRALLAADPPVGRAARQAVGYAETIMYLAGELSLEEAKERIRNRTHRLARKQLNWLRHFPTLRWIDVAAHDPAHLVAERVAAVFGEEIARLSGAPGQALS